MTIFAKSRVTRREKRLLRFSGLGNEKIARIINEALESLDAPGREFYAKQSIILMGTTRVAWILENLPYDDDPPPSLLGTTYLRFLRIVRRLCRKYS